MRCPFSYRAPRRRFSFGVAPEFLDFVMDRDRAAEAEFNRKYPTCWRKFLHWVGWN
jgi:hypothetical protein